MQFKFDEKVENSWSGYIKRNGDGEEIYYFGRNEVKNLKNPHQNWKGRSPYSPLTLKVLEEEFPELLKP